MGKLVKLEKTISILVDEEDLIMMRDWLDEMTSRVKDMADDEQEDLPGRLVQVDWDTDDEPVDLPVVIRVPNDVEEGEVADWLSDNVGFCVNSWTYLE